MMVLFVFTAFLFGNSASFMCNLFISLPFLAVRVWTVVGSLVWIPALTEAGLSSLSDTFPIL